MTNDDNEIVKELRELSRMLDTRLGEITTHLEEIKIALYAEEEYPDEDDDDEDF